MLVYLHAGEVRLERRPATGLWGGLWSLPECAMEADARQVAGLRGWEIESVRDLPTLDHAFSHFRLRIHPRLVSLRRRAHAADEPGQLWLPLADALEAALPTPVRKILAGLC
jgi:A/G-specific adenine glycosylase